LLVSMLTDPVSGPYSLWIHCFLIQTLN
jgi:hypothetical protein